VVTLLASLVPCVLFTLAEKQPSILVTLPGAVIRASSALTILVMLVALAGSMFYVCMLTVHVFPKWVGIVLGLLAMYPLVGVFVFPWSYWRATRLLKSHGYRVGLLRAEPPEF